MAFWRPRSMDAWNPFSNKFWTFANLFGRTLTENLAAEVQRQAVQRQAVQRQAVQRQAVQRQAVQRQPVQRQPVQRQSVQRQAVQRQAVQRQPVQRQAVQRLAARRQAARRQAARRLRAQQQAEQLRQRKEVILREATEKLAEISQMNSFAEQIPDFDIFKCPLTLEIFKDPVITNAGAASHVYESAGISTWLASNTTCPLTRQQLGINHRPLPFPEYEDKLAEYKAAISQHQQAAAEQQRQAAAGVQFQAAVPARRLALSNQQQPLARKAQAQVIKYQQQNKGNRDKYTGFFSLFSAKSVGAVAGAVITAALIIMS